MLLFTQFVHERLRLSGAWCGLILVVLCDIVLAPYTADFDLYAGVVFVGSIGKMEGTFSKLKWFPQVIKPVKSFVYGVRTLDNLDKKTAYHHQWVLVVQSEMKKKTSYF